MALADPEGPVCAGCKATSSLMWQRTKSGTVLCLECHNAEKTAKSSTPSSETSSQTGSHTDRVPHSNSPPRISSPTVTTRRATRSRERNNRAKLQVSSISNSKGNEKQSSSSTKTVENQVKGTASQDVPSTSTKDHNYQYLQRSRRALLKEQQQPMKAPLPQPFVVTSESVDYKGTKYEVGDIVSVLDRGGGVYYAIIRGFLLDQYAEKHAVLTWLLPRYPNPTHFDPALFVLGPEEDTPRSIDYLNFVSHSPQSRHFQASYFHDLEQAELWRQT